MGQTTITIDDETLERFKTARDDATPEDVQPSADTWLNQLLDNWEREQNDVTLYGSANTSGVATDAAGQDISPDRLDRIESSVETIEERTGTIERELEGLQR